MESCVATQFLRSFIHFCLKHRHFSKTVFLLLCLLPAGPGQSEMSLLSDEAWSWRVQNERESYFRLRRGPLVIGLKEMDRYPFANLQGSFWPIDFQKLSMVPKKKFLRTILKSVPKYLEKKLERYLPFTLETAIRYGVDPFWVLAIMWVESQYNQKALSHVGAVGVMQIMPKTAIHLRSLFRSYRKPEAIKEVQAPLHRDFVFEQQLLSRSRFRAFDNIEMGICYLRYLFDEFEGNVVWATVSYNMGPYRVRKRLENNLPVGRRNLYLDKVQDAYSRLIKSFYFHVIPFQT